MNSAVVYYSYSGNTRRVAQALSAILKEKGQVQEVELSALDESGSFLGQCQRAFRHKKALLKEVNFDISGFDLICFGTPVWAFGPAPALNTFLEKCSGVAGKKVVLFTTYGSGAGNERCLKFMQDTLAKKGVQDFNKFSIQQFKIADNNHVSAIIKNALAF